MLDRSVLAAAHPFRLRPAITTRQLDELHVVTRVQTVECRVHDVVPTEIELPAVARLDEAEPVCSEQAGYGSMLHFLVSFHVAALLAD